MNWHPFAQRFPLLEGEEWEAFLASIKKAKGNTRPVEYRLVDGEPEGIDGRNRYRACEQLSIKCRMKRVTLTTDEAVVEHILNANLRRRHMSADARAEIVAELRSRGKSVREIATIVGVTKSTAHRDLHPVPNGTPARQLCQRCARVGAVAGCPNCRELRARGMPREPGVEANGTGHQVNGRVLFAWGSVEQPYGALVRAIDTFGKAFDCKESAEAAKLRRMLADWLTEMKAAYKAKQKVAV